MIFSASFDMEYLYKISEKYPDIYNESNSYISNDDIEDALGYFYDAVSQLETLDLSRDEFIAQATELIIDVHNNKIVQEPFRTEKPASPEKREVKESYFELPEHLQNGAPLEVYTEEEYYEKFGDSAIDIIYSPQHDPSKPVMRARIEMNDENEDWDGSRDQQRDNIEYTQFYADIDNDYYSAQNTIYLWDESGTYYLNVNGLNSGIYIDIPVGPKYYGEFYDSSGGIWRHTGRVECADYTSFSCAHVLDPTCIFYEWVYYNCGVSDCGYNGAYFGDTYCYRDGYAHVFMQVYTNGQWDYLYDESVVQTYIPNGYSALAICGDCVDTDGSEVIAGGLSFGGATDFFGDNCDDYWDKQDQCGDLDFGGEGYYNNGVWTEFNSNEMCCACGGGGTNGAMNCLSGNSWEFQTNCNEGFMSYGDTQFTPVCDASGYNSELVIEGVTCVDNSWYDCNGDCNGPANLDGSGACCDSGAVDCNGLCDGTALVDCNGLCDGPGITIDGGAAASSSWIQADQGQTCTAACSEIGSSCIEGSFSGTNIESVALEAGVTTCDGYVNWNYSTDYCGTDCSPSWGQCVEDSCCGGGCVNICNGGNTDISCNNSYDGYASFCFCEDQPVDECCISGIVDCAGECDGDSELSGCDSACNSTAVNDDCGECGGSTVANGDANADGTINISDIIIAVDHIVGINLLSDEMYCVADINRDNNVNITDCIILIEVILDF